MKLNKLILLGAVLCISLAGNSALSQGTAFTYQGRLNDGPNPANGTYDLRFAIYDDATAGTQQGNAVTNAATAVSNGLFTVTLDFGNQFLGADRWMEMGVRTNGGGTFNTLNPRQRLTPTPYATYATYAGNVSAAGISGQIADTQLSANIARLNGSNVLFTGTVQFNNTNNIFNGTFTGNGASLTNVPLASLNTAGRITWGKFVASPGNPFAGANAAVAADVNGDGKVDLIGANYYNNTLTVLTNDGNGGFAFCSAPHTGPGPYALAAADVNGDGKVDLISANNANNTLTILTNDGSGGFVPSSFPVVGPRPTSVVAADFDGDGTIDLATANFGTNGLGNTLTVLTNNGSGHFSLLTTVITASGLYAVAAGNIFGSGRMDLAAVCFNDNEIILFRNRGWGYNGIQYFTGDRALLAGSAGNGPQALALADVDGDGQLDVISANTDNTLSVFKSSSAYHASTNSVGSFPTSVAAVDVNGDGKVDLISANSGNGTLSVLTNDSSGGFVLSSSPGVGGAEWVVAADVNGDGKVDLISQNGDSTLAVLLNTPGFNGDGSGLTGLSAANITGGTLADARLSANVALLGASQTFSGQNTFNNSANSFSGNGSGLTSLNAANVSSGALADARLSANVPRLNANQTFTGTNSFTGNVGIGTTTPQAQFNVSGSARIDASSSVYGEGLTLNLPTDMTGGGYGGIHFHNGTRGGVFDASTIKWGMFYNYTPEGGIGAKGFSIAQSNLNTRLYISTNGNVGIGTINPTNRLHVAGGVSATAFVNTSDRAAKENFKPISTQEILTKVTALPITTWTFKEMKDGEHLGPVAQDFYAAFALGGSDRTITVSDEAGVALAAIRGLNEKLESKGAEAESRIQTLEAENAGLKARLEKLERLLTRENNQSTGSGSAKP